MNTLINQPGDHADIQGKVGSEIMNMADIPQLPSDSIKLQTREYSDLELGPINRRGQSLTNRDSESPGVNRVASRTLHYVFLDSWKSPRLAVLDSDLSSISDPYLFSLDAARRHLQEIRHEVEETCAVADDVKAIPETAYDEALLLFTRIQRSIPMPDMMWLEDGGIGLEWRPRDGIATMSLYGDNHVIYGAFFNDKREVNGICSLSDSALLTGFLTTMSRLFQNTA